MCIFTLKLEAKNRSLENNLQKRDNELELHKKDLMKEKVRSEVIEKFYENRLHPKACSHSCQCKDIHRIDSSAHKQCQILKDKVNKLESDMTTMELSYITKLNAEIIQCIDKNVRNKNTMASKNC